LAELTGGGDPEAIVFTSGATEGANAFFRVQAGWSEVDRENRLRTVISPFEHPSVREPARKFCRAETMGSEGLERLLAEREALEPRCASGVDEPNGRVSAPPLVVAWMAANNETGEVFPWQRWVGSPPSGQRRHRFLCDASQWMGKLPAAGFGDPSVEACFLVGCAHKFGGPKGVGFLRLGALGESRASWGWQWGGPQEHGVRAGTEDVAGVAAMVAALEWCEDQMPGSAVPRDTFEHELGWPVVAGDRPRLWNTSMVVAPRHQNKLWLARLSQRGFQCSTGSACSSGQDGDSHVLAAMGLPPDAMRRVLRFSSGWTTTADDWRALRCALGDVQRELDSRAMGVEDRSGGVGHEALPGRDRP